MFNLRDAFLSCMVEYLVGVVLAASDAGCAVVVLVSAMVGWIAHDQWLRRDEHLLKHHWKIRFGRKHRKLRYDTVWDQDPNFCVWVLSLHSQDAEMQKSYQYCARRTGMAGLLGGRAQPRKESGTLPH